MLTAFLFQKHPADPAVQIFLTGAEEHFRSDMQNMRRIAERG